MGRVAASGLLLSLLWLSACSVKLIEVRYTPPAPAPRVVPSPAPGQTPLEALLEKSKKETKAGTKVFVINGLIAPEFAAAVGLSSANCAQAGEMSDGQVVVDFGNVACPEAGGLLPADNIAFTLFYESNSEVAYDLVLETESLGSIGINPYEQTATLSALCTGDYASVCRLVITDGKFSTLKFD